MKTDVILANAPGILPGGRYVIHSPSRWSESFRESEKFFSYYPFFLGYLSSLLKKYTPLKVHLTDGCLKRQTPGELLEYLHLRSPSFLIMEPASLVYRECLSLALELKKRHGTRILFAGPHVSLFTEEALKEGVDYVFRGEYEQSILRFFIERLYENSLQRVFEREHFLHFSDYPWPEDEDLSRYLYACPGEPSSEYREIQLYASRGCRGSCPFCVARQIYYSRPFHEERNPADVLREMDFLKNRYPLLEGFFFDEEDHFGNPDFNKNLCHLLIEKGAPYKIEALGRVSGIDPELLPLLKKAGYYKIRIGIESFDPDIQKYLGKINPPEKVRKFSEACIRSGIQVYASFQVGLPLSSSDKDRKTLELISSFLKEGLFHNVQVSMFTPFPGTQIYNTLKEKGFLTTENLSHFNGGSQSVVNWPEYTAAQIIKTYKDYLNLRDHQIFKRHLQKRGVLKWIFRNFQKHGPGTLSKKLWNRVKREGKYIAGL